VKGASDGKICNKKFSIFEKYRILWGNAATQKLDAGIVVGVAKGKVKLSLCFN
jgi:hypothetical protein